MAPAAAAQPVAVPPAAAAQVPVPGPPYSPPYSSPRPTPLGRGIAACAIVLGAAAVLLRYTEVAGLAVACLVALVLAAVSVARWPAVAVEIVAEVAHVRRGEPATATVRVVNTRSRRAPAFFLDVSCGAGRDVEHEAPSVASIEGRPSARGARSRRRPKRPWPWQRAPASSEELSGGRRRETGLPRDRSAMPPVPRRRRPPGYVVLGVPAIRGDGTREFTIELDTTVRGVITLGPARLRRADPFGLVARTGQAGGTAAVWVRPHTVPLEPLPSPRSREPDGPRSDGAGGAVLFNALREYLPGDDLRFVHWLSSARAGVLLVREHSDPSEPTATVLLDTRRQAYPTGPAGAAAFEDAVDVAASVVLAFAGRRYPVRLVTTGGLAMHSRRWRSGAGRLLDALAAVATDGDVATAGTEGDAATAGGVAEGGGRGLGVLATLPRGGVGVLTLVTGRVEMGQIAGVSPVAHRFEQVVVVRVGEHRYLPRPALRRLAPVPLHDVISLTDIQPVATLRDETRDRHNLDDEPAVRLAGRLRVVTVSTARDLPGRWPADGRRAVPTAGTAGTP